MADTSTTSVIVPAFHEAEGIADVISALVTAGPWHEIIVVDDGSSDDTGGQARGAGATVLRHPYNKGNGAAVKTGLRHATGVHVLIVEPLGMTTRLTQVRVSRSGRFMRISFSTVGRCLKDFRRPDAACQPSAMIPGHYLSKIHLTNHSRSIYRSL